MSDASSVRSKQSGKSGTKYKGKQTEIDESLFGSVKTKPMKQVDPKLRSITDQVRVGDYSHPDVVVISESELQRMKNNAIITTKEEQLQQKKILEEQKEKQQAAAKAKKARMLQMEEEKKKQVPLSDIQKEEKVAKDSLKARAEEILNEQLDDVKTMNQMVMKAQVVTVRDKQLDEKKQRLETLKNEEKRKDLMTEIERLKGIQKSEEEDKRHKEEQKKGHLQIIDQIKQRDLQRLRDKEAQELEGQVIVKEIKAMEKEESENAIRKKSAQKKLLDEIYYANQNSIMFKQKKLQQEKEEEDKIMNYLLERQQKQFELQAEQKRLKDQKEREVQKLREMQEKAIDRQAELDNIRAKRANEQNERIAREKELTDALNRQAKNEELMEARTIQMYEKEKRLQEQARQERDEFQKTIQAQKQERDLELKIEKEREELLKQHAAELRKQISIKEELREQDTRDRLEEGKKVKDNLDNQMKTLETIKAKKLNELNKQGIKPKYTAELAKKKITI